MASHEKATMSATVSDNDTHTLPTTTTTTNLPPSDDGAQGRDAGQTISSKIRSGKTEQEDTENKKETNQKEEKESRFRFPKLKREKSYSETLERKKKKVKFSASDEDDEVIVNLHVYDPQVTQQRQPSATGPERDDGAISSTLKKLLKKKSKKRKANIETQTDEKENESKKDRQEIQEDVQTEAADSEADVAGYAQPLLLPSKLSNEENEGDSAAAAENTACVPQSNDPESACASVFDSLKASVTKPLPGSVTSGEDASRDVRSVARMPTVPYIATIAGDNSTVCEEKDERVCMQQSPLVTQVPENESIVYPEISCHCISSPMYGNDGEPNADLISQGKVQYCGELQLTPGVEQSSLTKSDDSSSTSAVLPLTVKRDGTFTLDGPPAKITKSGDDAAGLGADSRGETPQREIVMEPMQFFVALNELESSSHDSGNSTECTSGQEHNKKPVPKGRFRKFDNNKDKAGGDAGCHIQTAAVKSLKSNAKRTFTSVWRTATKNQDSTAKTSKPAGRTSPAKVQDKPVTTSKRSEGRSVRSTSWERQPTPTPTKECREQPRRGREPFKTPQRQCPRPRTPPEKNSVWVGMSLGTFRREGTFTKKYDAERDRLQAECNKLSVEKDRLQSELHEARTRLEGEVAARKALKRNHELSLRQLRDGELKKTEVLLADLRNRLEDDRREALVQQKEHMLRSHEAELVRAEREREEDQRRLLQEARSTQEKLKAEMRREVARSEVAPVSCHHCTDRDLDRLNRDLSTLRDHKKRLEEAVHTLQESERARAGELRRLHDEHEAAVARIHRANKSEAARLLDELRGKERTIGQLERQLSCQSAKLRLHEDKHREGSNDRTEDAARKLTTRGTASGATSKRHKEAAATKDGRPREKQEPCVSLSHSTSPSRPPPGLGRSLSVEAYPGPSHAPPTPHPTSTAMAAEVEQLRLHLEEHLSQIEQQKSQIEEYKAQVEKQEAEIQQQKTQIEQQAVQTDEQKEQIEKQKSRLDEVERERREMEESYQELQREVEQQREADEEERRVLEQQVDEMIQQVEEQRQVTEAQKQVMEEQKQVMEEQHLRIVELTEEVMEQECLTSPPHHAPWHLRRESCVKVCELPTVMEQASDDESSPASSPTDPDAPAIPPLPAPDRLPLHPRLEELPTILLTPSTPGSTEPPLWPQVNDMDAQYAQLSKEHQDLQKSYQLLASSTNGSPGIDFPAKDGAAAWLLSARVLELEAECSTLRMELQETRDHADLLEFRCLELTEGADKSLDSGATVETCDQSTSTDADDVSSAVTNEDLSLPLSIDSGLDVSGDHKARVCEARVWLTQLSAAAPDSPAALHLTALLDWLAALPAAAHHVGPMSPTLATPPGRSGGTLEGREAGRDLMVLAARLQESLADPAAQEAVLLDTITKLRGVDRSLCELQERVVSLTDENRELHETVASLSEAQETRTEASGTESELVHRKTPSINSDLSDAELSDSPEHVQHRPGKLARNLEAATSFQESGIFDTSCEMVTVATQTESESDEYLRAALDEERVSLSKVEYDAIVARERTLQQELDHLKCEKQQLILECDAVKTQMRNYSASRGTDAEEALKGEIRVLRQRLTASERCRQEVFEEKCELEEEENDSRLMVQRLESQMEAAREMENLLSASLSQEQEISRELHHRVRELQMIEKDYRNRFERMEYVKNKSGERIAQLSAARDALATQLSFAAYGLLFTDYWRHMVAQAPGVLMPYCSKFSGGWSNTHRTTTAAACVQTSPQLSPLSTAPQEMECYTRVGERRPADPTEDEPASKRQRNTSTRNQATMTLKCESLSEREQYYLEQIEALQKEKMSLRKGHDLERRDSLQQHHNLEGDLQELRQRLEEAERDKCAILFRLEEMQDLKDDIERSLLLRIEELKNDMSRYNDIYELEKKSIIKEHDRKLAEVEKERSQVEERVHQLELQISTFRQELEIVGVSVANDLVEMDTEMENVLSQGRKSSLKSTGTDGQLLEKIRDLVKSETSLRQRIYDLEKKECAYRETIREADKIMTSHVTSYKQRIEDLEASAEQQASKIQQLETSEERLRATLRNNSRTNDGARITDLLDRLIETENSELKLKERVWNLEKTEKELRIKLMEAEKGNQSLRSELRDQEELIHRLMTLETENNSLSAELNHAQDSARKMGELQQSESYLRGRVEELEATESMLRETLHQADLILTQREKKLRDQISSLQEEVHTYKGQLEAAMCKEDGAKEIEVSYRKQVEQLRSRLAEAERELHESSSETISYETQHRSEVTKLRNQLKLGNSQLLEIDRLNCELRDQVLTAEAEKQQLAKQLEDHSRRHEQDLLSLNLQVSAKDSRLEELESQLEQLRHDHEAGELDVLAASPIAALHTSITALSSSLKNCESCSEAQSETLAEVTSQLGTLAELLEGRPTDDHMDSSDEEVDDASEIFEKNSAENLANEATTTVPPAPAQEGSREQCGDPTGCLTSGSFQRSFRRRSRRRFEEHSSKRLPHPQGSTILEELEEKIRELEEVVGRKEEELRLADIEASELNNKLQSQSAAYTNKCEEVEHINATLASLRQQLLSTMQDAECNRLSLQAKHKVDLEQLSQQIEQITEKAQVLAQRGQVKDSIISTLVSQIRAILRSGNMGVIINQLKRIQRDSMSEEDSQTDQQQQDFDVVSVCELLAQPSEMASLSQSTILNGLEPSNHVPPTPDTLVAPSNAESGQCSHVTNQGSSSLAQHRKSRIPRFLPSSLPCVKPAHTHIPTKEPPTVPLQARKPHVPILKTVRRLSLHIKSSPGPKRAPEPLSPSKPAAEFPQRVVETSPSESASHMKLMATSTPPKPSGRKDSTRQDRPTRLLSDARKVKRMVAGTRPLSAAVECASAPEWRERSPLGSTSSEAEATCIPRPQNLHITRRVGVDGVVIAWAPIEHDCVAGFQVLVGGRVVQHVRSPHRTKALVTGLPLAGSFTIGLVAVAEDGRCSTPVIVTQDRSRVYPGRTSSRPLHRPIPTSL